MSEPGTEDKRKKMHRAFPGIGDANAAQCRTPQPKPDVLVICEVERSTSR